MLPLQYRLDRNLRGIIIQAEIDVFVRSCVANLLYLCFTEIGTQQRNGIYMRRQPDSTRLILYQHQTGTGSSPAIPALTYLFYAM